MVGHFVVIVVAFAVEFAVGVDVHFDVEDTVEVVVEESVVVAFEFDAKDAVEDAAVVPVEVAVVVAVAYSLCGWDSPRRFLRFPWDGEGWKPYLGPTRHLDSPTLKSSDKQLSAVHAVDVDVDVDVGVLVGVDDDFVVVVDVAAGCVFDYVLSIWLAVLMIARSRPA